MLSDDVVNELERYVTACDAARDALEEALDRAEASGTSAGQQEPVLEQVAQALKRWQKAQKQFMATVAHSSVSDVPMAALLLKKHEEIDASNARRGLPGASVEGTDQPFDIDLTGRRGSVLTTVAMEYLPQMDDEAAK